MSFWYYFLIVLGIILLIILVFGYPRKKSDRKPNIEGLDSPEVAKSFEKMTELLPFKILHNKVIAKLKKYNPSGKLIDVGCGSGNVIIKIAKRYPSLELIGIDISSQILELAKKKANLNKVEDKIQFKIGNADNLPISDSSVDFVISTLSMHHWTDPIKVLEEICRVLKNDGIFIIFDFRRDSRKFFYGFLKFVTKVIVPKPLKKVNEPLGSLKSSYTLNEVLELVNNISLQNIEINSFLAWMFIIGKK
ncbi:MAG: class I SAM-dependent methyltransferase [Candidatus Helarchaeota archaeon]